MDIGELLNDKTIKAKQKAMLLSNWVVEKTITIDRLIAVAKQEKDPIKATIIEAIAYATLKDSSLADNNTLLFASNMLLTKAPRVKWESAKVIGNIAHLFPQQLDVVIANLLRSTIDEGTVVRWSMAFALGEILKLNLHYNVYLVPKLNDICSKEEKNSIRQIYLKALKKVKDY